MKLVLFGQEHTKRTDYMRKASEELGVSLELVCWDLLKNGYDFSLLTGGVAKIDPPSYQTITLPDMQEQLITYQTTLRKLQSTDCHFLNSPEAICRMLDKRETKLLLQQEGVPVTRMFLEKVQNTKELLELLHSGRCYSVFVKPRFFSGAAGVSALRIHPVHKKMILYTSCYPKNDTLINTKKLRRIDDTDEIHRILNKLLALDCVIERWHPKSEYHGKSYDLRVVYQFGHIAHIVVRQSGSPITNLHLNNQALDIKTLNLSEETILAIADVCESAISKFDGLNMAGIDILLERETMNPLVIEMNGQGDLIYQDIYADNKIYKEQVQYLCR